MTPTLLDGLTVDCYIEYEVGLPLPSFSNPERSQTTRSRLAHDLVNAVSINNGMKRARPVHTSILSEEMRSTGGINELLEKRKTSKSAGCIPSWR